MGAPERSVINDHLANLPADTRMFRINSGMAWQGSETRRPDGSLLLQNPRPFHGAPAGFPDMIGWQTIEITADMVGQKVAVFTAVEAKTGRLQLSKFQRLFRDALVRMGGQFKTVRAPTEKPQSRKRSQEY